MNDAPTIYLHIGLPKTGTTYLQKQIFPKLHSLNYLHKPLTTFLQDGSDPIYGIMDRAFKHSAAIWEGLGDEIFSRLTRELKDPSIEPRSLLISDEGAVGSRPYFLRSHLNQFSKKAAEWGFESLKIICIFRRQDQWIGSHYAQTSNRNPNASQRDFEAFVDAWLDKKQRYYSKGIVLDYKTLRDQLVMAVGADSVLMLPYELLKTDSPAYINRILDFLNANVDSIALEGGTETNSQRNAPKHNVHSLTHDVWAIRDQTLKDTRTIQLRPGRLFNALGLPTVIPLRLPNVSREPSIRLTEPLKKKVLAAYAQSNRAFAADLGMDLKQYGY